MSKRMTMALHRLEVPSRKGGVTADSDGGTRAATSAAHRVCLPARMHKTEGERRHI